MLASKTSDRLGEGRLWQPFISSKPLHVRAGVKFIAFMLCLATFCTAAALQAQTFQATPGLYFTKAYAGADPISQVLPVASTGANFGFTGSAVSLTGGNWLTIDNLGCCSVTPYAMAINAHPDVTLAAGTYTGQIVLTSSNLSVLTIPVTLNIEPSTAAFFDALAGGLTYSVVLAGKAPPAQPLQIRNAGTGTLTWTASASTADGGAWLKLSAANGTAPFTLNVSIVPGSLPGIGLTAGTFAGQVVLQASGDRVTVPITVTVGSTVFNQVNPLNFTKEYAGANPLSQLIGVSSTGANFGFTGYTVSSTGGNWLTIDSLGCCSVTPYVLTVGADPDITLAAGTYTAQIILKSAGSTQALVIPVTLTVEPSTATFFDDVAGGLAYSMIIDGSAPPAQPLQIRNAGAGTLNWAASASTADGGAWLKLSAASGTAPSVLNVSIAPAGLPGTGLTAGTFVGQVVLQASGVRVTIPIVVTVGPSVFNQVNPLNFTKVFAGGNPLSQLIAVSSTGANFGFTGYTVSSTGGNWLTIDNLGCCSVTPYLLTVTANPAVTLAEGTYSAEIILKSAGSSQALIVPVTLTIEPPTPAFFDSLSGGLTYSMVTAGTAPPAQPLQIRNAGEGTLTWTASASTADGGAWLKLSAASGTAPSILSVSIIPGNLPGTGLTAGTFTGEVVLQTTGDRVTVPITVTVGSAVFRQVNPLNFTKLYAGANPLPQMIAVASTGTNFGFTGYTVSSTGGNWLTIDSLGCCSSTPYAITVTANPDVTLAAGTYSAEIVLKSSGSSEALVVPVTLSIEPSTSTFFDALPGSLTYSLVAAGAAPPAQPLQIRNAGSGTLNWSASSSTSDGGAWLKLSAATGTAPSTLNVSINPANLPGLGLVAGTFSGEVVLDTVGDRVTVPITVTVGASVFVQVSPVAFTKSVGGANPPSQPINISSTGANLGFTGIAVNSTGGNWLTITNLGCCSSTPFVITATANPAVTLVAGIYSAEILLKTAGSTEPMIIQVSLTVNGTDPAATPAFTPPGGTYTATQSVVITDSTPNSAIHYTTDGSTPLASSPVYSKPITVAASETIKAIATSTGYLQSAVGVAAYTISGPVAETPDVSQTIAISDTTPGAVVHYTTDGSTPTASSPIYTGPIVLTVSSVLKFIAIAPGDSPSPVRTVSTTIH